MLLSEKLGLFEEGDDVEKRPANAPLLRTKDGLMLHFKREALARRCTSKDRGSIYDPVLGICCHFCRFCTHSRISLAYFLRISFYNVFKSLLYHVLITLLKLLSNLYNKLNILIV